MDEDGARLVPVDRKQKEMRIQQGDLGEARDGDLVEVEVKVAGRLMIPRARVVAVIGNPNSEGAVSMIARTSSTSTVPQPGPGTVGCFGPWIA